MQSREVLTIGHSKLSTNALRQRSVHITGKCISLETTSVLLAFHMWYHPARVSSDCSSTPSGREVARA